MRNSIAYVEEVLEEPRYDERHNYWEVKIKYKETGDKGTMVKVFKTKDKAEKVKKGMKFHR